MEANLQLEELNHLEEGWEMLTDEDFKLQQEDEETLLESVDSEERFSTLTKTNPNSIYIKGNFYFKGYKKYSLDLYVDTGASMCTANKHVIPEEFWVNAKNPIKARIANDSIMTFNKVAELVQVQIADETFIIPTMYQATTKGDITIGNNFCRLYEPFVQYKDMITFHKNGKAISTKKVTKAYFHGIPGFLESKKIGSNIPTPNPENITPVTIHQDNISTIFKGEEIGETLFSVISAFTEVEKLLDSICSEHPLDERINKGKFEAQITLLDPNKVIKCKPMQYSPQDREEFKTQIEELLKLGIIRPSKSPHSSPAFMVRNHAEIKRGKARMVINYKKLNDNTKGDGYLLPNKEQLLQRIGGKTYYSSFDCKSGFWQVRLAPETIQLTAFSCPQGHYEWLVMPFGLKQAPAIFQRHMDESLSNMYPSFCAVYVDDIIVFSKTEDEHLGHVKIVLNRCKALGIVLSKKKAQLCKTTINFLGLVIERGNLKVQSHIGLHLTAFPDQLADRNALQRFLGLLNYISAYFPKIANLRSPLQVKLKKEIIWSWTEKDTETVRKIKSLVKSLPDLYNPSPEDKPIIECDASDDHWGAVLKAKLPEGKEVICRYASGTFKPAEKNYHSNEKEILSIIKAIKAFRAYILPYKFLVRTDNTNAAYFVRTNIAGDYKQSRLVRWQMALREYSFDIEHVSGQKNVLADIMTREFAGKT
nr:putative reverse transcriptase [Strawberry vein banding virus]